MSWLSQALKGVKGLKITITWEKIREVLLAAPFVAGDAEAVADVEAFLGRIKARALAKNPKCKGWKITL